MEHSSDFNWVIGALAGFIVLPVFLFIGSSFLLRRHLTSLPPFVGAGCWFSRTVLITYLIPLELVGWLGTIVYSVCVFIVGGSIGQSLIRTRIAGGAMLGFVISPLAVLLWCTTLYVMRVPKFLHLIDPHYLGQPEDYGYIDGGAIGYLFYKTCVPFLVPIFGVYMTIVFVLAAYDLVKSLGKAQEPAAS